MPSGARPGVRQEHPALAAAPCYKLGVPGQWWVTLEVGLLTDVVGPGQEGTQQLRLRRAAKLPELFLQAGGSMVECLCGTACGCLWH